MKNKGMGTLTPIFMGALILVFLASFVYARKEAVKEEQNQQKQMGREELQDATEDGETLIKLLIAEGFSRDEAEYNLGIVYTFGALAGFAQELKDGGGGYERMCRDDKVNLADARLYSVLCGQTGEGCEETPHISTSRANARCYATKDEYTISANVFIEPGRTGSFCSDLAGTNKEGVASPQTFQCVPI